MTLDANDFGCVPDGRFLERASIAASSAVLTDPDGILRPTDVGKNIAIPGAADLVAKIANLNDRREVRDAIMNAGSKQLTGTLFNPDTQNKESFRKDLHTGRRITVAGVGPNGETLVSDIVKVINATTIELADAASTSVAGVEVILNRPNRVALDDYARRSVENLTIDLGDRSISDGTMIVGGRGLSSETARFSSLDLGKPVTIREAGLLVTTIQSFQSSTQVTLAAPAQRAVAEGQVDVWKTDSRPGLEALLASLESLEVESADIQFGPGVYDFTRSPNVRITAAIRLQGLKNLRVRGAGLGVTVLRLMPQQGLGAHVIETRDCERFTLGDLSVHGAYLTLAKTNEQMHGIFLNEGSEEVVVERVRVFQSAGDGLRFLGRAENPDLGTPENRVRKVWVEGCQFVQNKRTGVAFQRAAEFVWIRNCYIEMTPPSTDSCIDFEPTGFLPSRRAAPTDIIIDSNFMKHGTRTTAVSISGIAGPDPTRRVKFSNNSIVGGEIFCTDVAQLTIQNNTVVVTELGATNRIPIQIQRGGDSIVITGNLLVNDDTVTDAVIALSEVNQRQVTHALVANNLCFTRFGKGIVCLSSDDVVIQGNMVVATGSCTRGILVLSQSSDMDNISVRDNDIMAQGSGAWITGIQINSTDSHSVHHVSVIGNSVRNAAEGITFNGKKFEQTPICALNRIDAYVTSPLLGLDKLPEKSIVVGGATSRGGTADRSGGGRLISGLGKPEGKVTGNVGDLFQRLDVPSPDEEDPANLYVKTSGNNTDTGWMPK
jgi:hypothetical protein